MRQLNFLKNTAEGVFWGIINKFISIIFPFAIRTILIKKLGSEYAGLNSLFTSVLQVLSLAELGFGSAIVHEMYKPVAEDNVDAISALLNYYKKVYTLIGATIFAFGLCFIPFMKYLIKGSVPPSINIYILYLIYLFNAGISYLLFSYRASLLSAYQREADSALIQTFTNLLLYSIQIFILTLFKNYYLYIIFLPFSTLLYNFLRYVYSKYKYPHIKCCGEITTMQKNKVRKNISALFMHKIGSVTVNTFDNLAISAFLGLRSLSDYNNYYYIISAITSIVIILYNSITAGIGNHLIIESKNRNHEEFYILFYFNGIIVSIATTCLLSLYQKFITFWIGEKYLLPTGTMVLFCVYFFIHTIRRTIIVYRDAAGMWVDNKWQPIISSLVNFLFNIILIKKIGINGVLISTITSMLFIDIPWETNKLFNNLFNQSCKRYYLNMILYILITIISCILALFLQLLFRYYSSFIYIISEFIIALSVSLFVFVIFTFKTYEFDFIFKFIKISIFKIS